ncbi:hypothetical protein O6H91_Y289500 [Diphasiastrum complanatum]|nr:hypothetical protein O6H91_Y289500 [Diphasiastrum complanatum]
MDYLSMTSEWVILMDLTLDDADHVSSKQGCTQMHYMSSRQMLYRILMMDASLLGWMSQYCKWPTGKIDNLQYHNAKSMFDLPLEISFSLINGSILFIDYSLLGTRTKYSC